MYTHKGKPSYSLEMICNTSLQTLHKIEIGRRAAIVGIETKSALNCHEYYGTSGGMYQETTIPQLKHGSGKCASFLYASKVSQSCHPNVTYTSKTKDGRMEYKAVRAITNGDTISFPNTGNLWETPTQLRRKDLQDNRSFLCKCMRNVQAIECIAAKCDGAGHEAGDLVHKAV